MRVSCKKTVWHGVECKTFVKGNVYEIPDSLFDETLFEPVKLSDLEKLKLRLEQESIPLSAMQGLFNEQRADTDARRLEVFEEFVSKRNKASAAGQAEPVKKKVASGGKRNSNRK